MALFLDNILEVIFESLDVADLAACAGVCKKWRLEANRIKTKHSFLIVRSTNDLQILSGIIQRAKEGGKELQCLHVGGINVFPDFTLSVETMCSFTFWRELIPNTLTYLEMRNVKLNNIMGKIFGRLLLGLDNLRTLKLHKCRVHGQREIEQPSFEYARNEVPNTLTTFHVSIYKLGAPPFTWSRIFKTYKMLKELKLSVDRQEDLVKPNLALESGWNNNPTGMELDKLHLEVLQPWQEPRTRMQPFKTLDVLRFAPCRLLQELKLVDQFDRLMRPEVLRSLLRAECKDSGFQSTVTTLYYDVKDFIFSKEQHSFTRKDEQLHPQFLESLLCLTKYLPRVRVLEMSFSNETFRLVCEEWPQLEEINVIKSCYRYGDKEWHLDDNGIIGPPTNTPKRQKCKTIADLGKLTAFRMNTPNMLTNESLLKGFCAMKELKIVELHARKGQFSAFAQRKLQTTIGMTYITVTEQ